MNQQVFTVLVMMFLVMGGCKSQEQGSSWSSSISSLEVHSGQQEDSGKYLALGGGSDEQVCSKAISDLCILLEQGQSVEGGIFKRRLLAVPAGCQDQLRQAFHQVYGEGAVQEISTDLSTCYFAIHDRVPFLAGN